MRINGRILEQPQIQTAATHAHKWKRYLVKYLKHMVFVCVSSKRLRKVNNSYLYTIVTMNALLCCNKNVFISKQ